MSIVTVQLGQCGNQVGCELFDALAAHQIKNNTSDVSAFFRTQSSHRDGQKWVARSVLVDMEPRVVHQAREFADKSKSWTYAEANCHTGQSGSGNNWAHGYSVHGPASREKVLDIIRKELEQCDLFGGFLFLQSLAGGTGSGLGTYVTESVHDEYSSAVLMNAVVWPYDAGDVVVQAYNSVFTLCHLYKVSDGIITVENETVNAICTKLLNIQRPSFGDLNRVIAANLAHVLAPSRRYNSTESSSGVSTNILLDPIRHLCSHPSYKLLNIRATPQIPPRSIAYTVFSWPALLKHLLQMHVSDARVDSAINWNLNFQKDSNPKASTSAINKSLASVLYVRGKDITAADMSQFTQPSLYASWVEDPLLVCKHPQRIHDYEMAAALLSNSAAVISPLERVVNRASEMFQSSAYIHQYAKHGCDASFFRENLLYAEQILSDYNALKN
mmetsp:Transcript_6826/g.10699  ORF Transcript_6826/g.10699 Transcript_6826/m.10699 type:complete len:443 (+) Transcript_6826:226-1554(+)